MYSHKIAENLNPIQDLKNKNNYQKFIFIDENGNSKTRIILFNSDVRVREQIIFNHFISQYIQFFIGSRILMKIISRDKPWDFEIELSNSEKLIIEITSIADETNLFRIFKHQERIIAKSHLQEIEFHELIKLNELFPDDEINDLIDNYKNKKINKKELVVNPHYDKQFIFQSSISKDLTTFDTLIRNSINKKLEKNHPNKNHVTLIIDNRTVKFDLEDVVKYLNKLEGYFDSLPFKEIWLYTGYYSDLDGSNAEYSLVPLKIKKNKLNKIIKAIK